MSYPFHHDRAPESALVDYLEDARQLVLERMDLSNPLHEALPEHKLKNQFETFQWFELPESCVALPK
jgi:hypothetical protein